MTSSHKLYDLALRDHDMLPTIAVGPAGTGKTFGAVGFGVEWLQGAGNRKVIVTRPNVSFADEQGFLPGTEREKMEPWVRPILQNFEFHGMCQSYTENLEKLKKLIFMPLGAIQGLTFDNSLIIVDECENMTMLQLKVMLTRVGKYSKVVLCGDIAQTAPTFENSGLGELIKMVEHFDMRVHIINFTRDDIMRSKQCKQWIIAFEDWELLNAAPVRSKHNR